MKNKSLVTIVSLSVVLFIGLVFVVYNIAQKNDNEFYADGYVSVTDSEVSSRVYFKEGTVYKKGYNNEIVFKDNENKKTEVSKFSFVYYNNKAISYLSDGVLMALDELDSDYVPYYNIRSGHIIGYDMGHYNIKTSTKDIRIDNFIGRIDENKYLVAGNDLKLKLASSEELISNYYFEINFVEGNQVKIDNNKINVKTISEDSYIYVGNDVIIDLNNRIIKYKGNLKLNLSEITINSDENIDVLFDSGKNNEIDDGNGGNGGNGNGNGNGNGENQKQYEPEKVVEYKNVPYVELLETNISSNRIRLEYRVIDQYKLINGDVTVRYMNLATSEINEVHCANYDNLCVFDVQNLSSNTKFLVTILTSYVRNGILHNDFIMFQRTFKTSEINLSLEKEYVASDSLTYRVKMSNESNFSSAKLNLYNNSGELVDSIEFNNTQSDAVFTFDNLKSNQTYTAKIEDLVIGNVTFKSGDFGTSMTKTLKYNPLKDAPILNTPSATSNKIDYTFTFDLGVGEDKDNAIKEVEYKIYDSETDELVKTIIRENTVPFTFEVGEEFANDRTYVYQATLKINDNEKFIYQKTLFSNEFSLSSKVSPYSVFVRGEITANTLSGAFKIYDPDNTIDVNQKPYVEFVDSEGVKGTPVQLEYSSCGEDESATTKCVNVYLEGLSSDNTYTISLYSYVDLKDDPEKENYIEPGYTQVGIVQVKTDEADIVNTFWTDNTEIPIDELQQKVFEIDLQFGIDLETTSELVIDNMSTFDMILYEGSEENEVYLKTIHIGSETNIKDEYFTNPKKITLGTFGYSLGDLLARHMADGTRISQKYTIKLTNGRSGTDYVDFRPATHVFEIDPTLLEITNDNSTVNVKLIKNIDAEDMSIEGLEADTFVAMKIIPYFENKKYVKSIDYVIYDLTDGVSKYEFSHDNLHLENEDEIPNEILPIYGNQTEEFLKRGHTYQVTYTLSLDLNGDGTTDIVYPISSDINTPAPVKSDRVFIPKQVPTYKMLPWTSDSSSITYKYDVTDIDNALGTDPVMYYSVGTTEYTGDKENAVCAKSPNVNKDYNYAFDCIVLNSLNNKDIYTVYFKGRYYDDADATLDRFVVGNFEFESIMPESEIKNKFSFEISSKYNNLAVLSIDDGTSDNRYINRIANYSITIKTLDGNQRFIIENVNDGNSYSTGSVLSFSSNNKITYNDGTNNIQSNINAEPNLGSVAYVSYCDGVGGEKCIFIDYAKLYNSSTFGHYFQPLKGEDLLIEVGITYDTGKVGYYASTAKQYAFQVKSIEQINVFDQVINDTYYIATTNYIVNGSHYNMGALSGVYTYKPVYGGFVADSDGGGTGIEYNTLGRNGEINFTNGIYNGQSFNNNYELRANGVIINVNGFEHPILAKELANTTVTNEIPFKYTRVSPTIGVAISAPTINGIRLRLQTYGYANDDVDYENGKQYLYLEVYDTADSLVQTLKLDKNQLISQSGKVTNKKFKLNQINDSNYAEYKFNITKVEVNGVATTEYTYDYINGVITLKDEITVGTGTMEITDDTDIVVSYNIAVYSLDIDTEYYYMAYMMLNGQKTYLIDSTSKTYENAHKAFRTLNFEDPSVKLNDVIFSIDSLDDYETRYLVPSFTVGNDRGSEIIGFEDFVYEIKYNDELIELNPTNACQTRMDNYYATLETSCIINYIYYTAFSYLDISNGQVTKAGEPYKFVFGADYELVIKAKVKTTSGYDYEEIYRGVVPVRELEEPTIDVTKRSFYAEDKNALSFIITFNDPDRVLTGFDYLESSGAGITVNNGNYLAYLAKNSKRTRDSELTTYRVEGSGVTSLTYINGTLPEDVNGLQNDTDYYLILRYKTDTNNLNSTGANDQELRFPIYTLDESKVALGKVAYFASNEDGKGVSELTFSYATNIMEDENIENQEAYVAGMLYDVFIFGGDSISSDRVFFVDVADPDEKVVNINYVKNNNASSELGENYYQILLHHNEYPSGSSGASYIMSFQLYLGGNVAKDLNTEAKCRYTDGVENSNYWDHNNNKCYILSSLEHEYSAQFKGASLGGE